MMESEGALETDKLHFLAYFGSDPNVILSVYRDGDESDVIDIDIGDLEDHL